MNNPVWISSRVEWDNDDDDDAEEGAHVSSKYSKPIVQKQRMQYMENLNARKRCARAEVADEFSETY